MRGRRDMLDWAANTRSGNAVVIAASVVMGIAIVAFAWLAAGALG